MTKSESLEVLNVKEKYMLSVGGSATIAENIAFSG